MRHAMARLLAGLLALAAVPASAQSPGLFPSGRVYGNSSASTAAPSPQTLTAMFDRAFCSTANSALARISGSWACLATANSAIWATNSSGVPSLTQTLPNAVQDNITRVGSVASGSIAASLLTGTLPNAVQDNITRAGTITSGTWSATPIALNKIATIADKTGLVNISGGTASPTAVTLPSWLDSAFCNTVGYVVARMSGAWVCAQGLPANVQWFGALGTGVCNVVGVGNAANCGSTGADDTSAIRAAYATGATVYFPARPSGFCYRVTDSITITVSAQKTIGDDRQFSSICTSSVFATGVYICNAAGPAWQDIGIIFQQPDTATRGSLTTYQPAIYCRDTPRFKLTRVRISQATVALDMQGNTGGSTISDFEVSAYSGTILIDGAIDSTFIFGYRAWPFGLSTDNTTIFKNAATIGIISGRADGLHIVGGMSILGTAMKFETSVLTTGETLGSITNFGFDSNNGITMSAGNVTVGGGYFSLGSGKQAVNLSGGYLSINSVPVQAGNSSATPLIAQSGGALIVSNTSFDTIGADVQHIQTTGGIVNINNNQFIKTPTVAYADEMIHIGSTSTAFIQGNSFTDLTSGSGTAIKANTDNRHSIMGNNGAGWVANYPGGIVDLAAVNVDGALGVTCAGVTAATVQTYRGYLTHC